jgi:tetratricopeptide (TPR) repeat protein
VFESRGDVQEVVKVYELAAQSNPRYAWPHLKLGSLYAREDDLSSALTEYQKAIEIEPWAQEALADLRDLHWSLATSVGTADAYTEHAPLTWWPDGSWVRPYPDAPEVLVGRSVLTMEGVTRPDQIHLHPYGANQGTYLRFAVGDCRYDTIQIGYGLAGQVAGLSNGVRYSVQISADRGEFVHRAAGATRDRQCVAVAHVAFGRLPGPGRDLSTGRGRIGR